MFDIKMVKPLLITLAFMVLICTIVWFTRRPQFLRGMQDKEPRQLLSLKKNLKCYLGLAIVLSLLLFASAALLSTFCRSTAVCSVAGILLYFSGFSITATIVLFAALRAAIEDAIGSKKGDRGVAHR